MGGMTFLAKMRVVSLLRNLDFFEKSTEGSHLEASGASFLLLVVWQWIMT